MHLQRRIPRPTPAMGVALAAMFLATTGTGYAALSIGSNQIKNNSIRGKDIRNGTLEAVDLSKGLVAALKPKTGPAGPAGPAGVTGPAGPAGGTAAGLMWIDHFAFQPGDSSVTVTRNSVTSGVGGGLTALVISSSTTGEVANSGGNKDVQRVLEVPPGYTIKGVRVCYELTDSRSFISQIRLAQVEPTPSSALVLLDDATDQTDEGPVCVNSSATNVVASAGAVLLDLRVNFGNTADRIALRAVGLQLAPS